MLDHARRDLAAAEAALVLRVPDVDVQHELIVGYPVGVPVAQSRHAELAVVGDRGLSRIGGLLLGSVAMALAAHGACPVVVVRGAPPPVSTAAPVVVGIHGSPAYEQPALRGVSLVAVHTSIDAIADPAIVPLLDWDVIEADEQRVLAERLAG